MSRRDDQSAENPRTRRMREAVLSEGIRLLSEEGGAAVTALRISEGTGVARSTIYRHWPGQSALLLAVVERGVRPHGTPQITGRLSEDLRTVLDGLRSRLTIRPFRRVFATLLHQANGDPSFTAPQQRLVQGVLQPVTDVLQGAVERRQLPATLDLDAAALSLAGPLLVQHVMARAAISDALIDTLIRGFLIANPPLTCSD